ncbi:MAG: hypothetical protein JXB32_08635 [Deltaproteobacteria bacterium]|nr:hypothetical protein [Deltaproteobacteria bacterium]
MKLPANTTWGLVVLLGTAACGSVVQGESDVRADARADAPHPEDGAVEDASGDLDPGLDARHDAADVPLPDGSDAESCTLDEQCSDLEPCNGRESCDEGVCRPATPLADGSVCIPEGSVSSHGTCMGGVCVCVDQVVCFPDADNDGFGVGPDWTCRAECNDHWAADATDCCDSENSVHPGATGWKTESYVCTATDGGESFDFDCSGDVELQYPLTASGVCVGSSSDVCADIMPGWCSPDGMTGNLETLCVGVTVPACGASDRFVRACVATGDGTADAKATACRFEVAELQQACR